MYQILRCYYVAAADNGGSQGLADRSVRKRGRGYEKLSQGNPGHGQTLMVLPSLR
jgi:hypothetical protein